MGGGKLNKERHPRKGVEKASDPTRRPSSCHSSKAECNCKVTCTAKGLEAALAVLSGSSPPGSRRLTAPAVYTLHPHPHRQMPAPVQVPLQSTLSGATPPPGLDQSSVPESQKDLDHQPRHNRLCGASLAANWNLGLHLLYSWQAVDVDVETCLCGYRSVWPRWSSSATQRLYSLARHSIQQELHDSTNHQPAAAKSAHSGPCPRYSSSPARDAAKTMEYPALAHHQTQPCAATIKHRQYMCTTVISLTRYTSQFPSREHPATRENQLTPRIQQMQTIGHRV
ncbi:hypothetical protein CCMA1212_008668 [Trichoderma ghanense]|uniref:Uncharacterized protein n=1 Tax=Trichoderma ghanense TaxID=65468 RepID=A0ABY2GWF7_9HYPO